MAHRPGSNGSENGSGGVGTLAKLAGKGEGEVRALGAVEDLDRVDEERYGSTADKRFGPIHQTVWGPQDRVNLFEPDTVPALEGPAVVSMELALEGVRRHSTQGTALGADGKLADHLLTELGELRYFGAMIPEEYGGLGLSLPQFVVEETRMAADGRPSVAMLNSVTECIGAVAPLLAFGSTEQKQRWLPRLARGEVLSGFGLTEKGAGSDLTNISVRGVIEGGEIVLTGEKWFITNVIPGRLACIVFILEDGSSKPRPQVAVVEIPKEGEAFQRELYKLVALKELHNNGLTFSGLRVPVENLLTPPPKGDGLSIAYALLNRGRVSLCAVCGGTLRRLLVNMVPWGHKRVTFGAPLETRETSLYRYGRMAQLILGCDALRDWGAWLLHHGFRGVVECTTAKVFGSEALGEAAFDIFPKFSGGRALSAEHLWARECGEMMAPMIYEGENIMLLLAAFKALVDQHSKEYLEPIGKVMAQRDARSLKQLGLSGLCELVPSGLRYLGWMAGNRFASRERDVLPDLPGRLGHYAKFAIRGLQSMAAEISGVLLKHQLKLFDRQRRLVHVSRRVQKYVVMLVAALSRFAREDEVLRLAAETLCEDLRVKLTGPEHSESDEHIRRVVQLGQAVADRSFAPLIGIDPEKIVMDY